jgi:hypothetical protein
VLYGNIAVDGCIVKTAGVDESIWKFSGRARVYESQDAAVEAILGEKVVAGDVVVIRYEGPKGGPGMQEMLYPTSYLKSMGLGKACALMAASPAAPRVSPSVTPRRKRRMAAQSVWLKRVIPSKSTSRTAVFGWPFLTKTWPSDVPPWRPRVIVRGSRLNANASSRLPCRLTL